MQINKLNSVHLICANMNALVLPRLIFTLSDLKWIKVLLICLQANFDIFPGWLLKVTLKNPAYLLMLLVNPDVQTGSGTLRFLSFILTPDQLIVLYST